MAMPVEGEGVGEAVGLPVHDDEADEEEAEDGEADYSQAQEEAGVKGAGRKSGKSVHPPCVPELTPCIGKPEGDGQFDDGILPGDYCVAVAAASAEDEPA